jgi:hypothetical protein
MPYPHMTRTSPEFDHERWELACLPFDAAPRRAAS